MVWVITGQLNSMEGATAVPESSHYLRPSRSYTLGRPAASADSSKQRAFDFRIKNIVISSKGSWSLVTGSWTAEQVVDDPSSATNLDPYTLHFTLSSTKPSTVTVNRNGELIIVASDETIELKSGDIVPTTSKLEFKVEWFPVFPCVANVAEAKKQAYIEQAASLGIKLRFKTFQHTRHTHYLTKSLLSGVNLLHAAMSAVPVASPRWLDDFLVAGSVEPAPADQPRRGGKESIAAFERRLVRLKDDVGSDYERWWGHSALEKDWTTRPVPTDPRYACTLPKGDEYASWTWEKWNLNERRRRLFGGILVVSFREEGIMNTIDSDCVKLGSGTFLAISLDEHANDPASIVAEIEAFKTSEDLDPNVKVVLISSHDSDEDENEETPTTRLLKVVAHRLGATKVLPADNQIMTNAICAVDTSELFGPPFDPNVPEPSLAGPAVKSKAHVLAPASSPLQEPTPSSTFGTGSTFHGAPGTHSEEQSMFCEPAFVAVADAAAKQGGMEAGPSGTNAGDGGDQGMAPPPPRKLTRRAKTHAQSNDLWGSMGVGQETRDPVTQDPSPELSLAGTTPGSSMDVDSTLPSSSQARPKLKRRAGTVETQQSDLFDLPDPDRRPAKKSRQQLIDEEAEEDAARSQSYSAKSSPQAKGKGPALSAVNEEEEEEEEEVFNAEAGPSTSSRSKKRLASEAVSSGDEASTSNKTSTKKRLRSTSEQAPKPTVATSKKKPPPAKKGATATKKGGKAPDDGLLRMKTIKRKGAELDQALNDEFNAMRIPRPTAFVPMKTVESCRIGWDERDLDEEHMRLIREDQEDGEHPEDWGGKEGRGIFIVERVSMVKKDRAAPRTDIELEEKYAGRQNFKKFRPKNSALPVVPREQRPRIKFVISGESADFGLGDAYLPAKVKAKERAFRTGQDFDSDDSDDDMGAKQTQSKLSFKAMAKPKPKPAAKGKRKQVAIESSDDSSHTLRDEMDAMDVDSSDEDVEVVAGPSKGKAKAPAKKAPPKKPATRAPAKKALPTTIVIDSDSESDGGRTFKGFGTKRKP